MRDARSLSSTSAFYHSAAANSSARRASLQSALSRFVAKRPSPTSGVPFPSVRHSAARRVAARPTSRNSYRGIRSLLAARSEMICVALRFVLVARRRIDIIDLCSSVVAFLAQRSALLRKCSNCPSALRCITFSCFILRRRNATKHSLTQRNAT